MHGKQNNYYYCRGANKASLRESIVPLLSTGLMSSRPTECNNTD